MLSCRVKSGEFGLPRSASIFILPVLSDPSGRLPIHPDSGTTISMMSILASSASTSSRVMAPGTRKMISEQFGLISTPDTSFHSLASRYWIVRDAEGHFHDVVEFPLKIAVRAVQDLRA